jgi:hypothetical protein
MTMNDNYVQGFIQKCAEAGVDPEELVKRAARGDQAYGLLKLLGIRGEKAIRTLQAAAAQQWARPMVAAPSGEEISELAETLWAMKRRTAMSAPSSYEQYLNRVLNLPSRKVRKVI